MSGTLTYDGHQCICPQSEKNETPKEQLDNIYHPAARFKDNNRSSRQPSGLNHLKRVIIAVSQQVSANYFFHHTGRPLSTNLLNKV
jgi:hypothetical protein